MTETNGATTAPTSADEWRKRASELALSKTTNLELPSGATVLVRRPPLTAWLRNGRLPESLTRLIVKASQDSTAELQAKLTGTTMTGDEQLAMIKFMQDLVLYAVVRPKLVMGVSMSPDEIGVAEIPEEDSDFLFSWVMQGSPQIPIPTTEGEVEPKGLSTFRTF